MPRSIKTSTIVNSVKTQPFSARAEPFQSHCLGCEQTQKDCEKRIEQLESKHRQIVDLLSQQYKKDSLKLSKHVEEYESYGDELYKSQKILNQEMEKELASLRQKFKNSETELDKAQTELEELRVGNLKKQLKSLPKIRRGASKPVGV